MTTATATRSDTYSVDPAHSRLEFTVRHMGFSKVRGSFEAFEGTVGMVSGDLSTLTTEATIQAESITTNSADRDAHLRSDDFFEVERYPTITFTSKEVRKVSGDAFELVGDFTLHGVTREIELSGRFLGAGTDPWGGTRVAFEASTSLNRKDFGLNWNAAIETGGVLVSDRVDITLEIQAVRQDQEAS